MTAAAPLSAKPPRPRRGKKTVVIALIAVLVLGGVGAAAWKFRDILIEPSDDGGDKVAAVAASSFGASNDSEPRKDATLLVAGGTLDEVYLKSGLGDMQRFSAHLVITLGKLEEKSTGTLEVIETWELDIRLGDFVERQMFDVEDRDGDGRMDLQELMWRDWTFYEFTIPHDLFKCPNPDAATGLKMHYLYDLKVKVAETGRDFQAIGEIDYAVTDPAKC